MAGSGKDVRAGKAFVELYVKNSRLMKGLKDAQQRIRDFGNGIATAGKWMMGIGAAITAPLAVATKQFMDAGDQVDDMAARTGISTNALAELGFAAEQSGTSIEAIENVIRKMQRTISEAAAGEKSYADAIKSINLAVSDLQGLSPDQQFEKIAEQLSKIKDPTQRAAAAMEIFGKSGTAILPMLGNIKALREEARRLGLSIRPEQAKAAGDLADAWNRVKRSIGAAFFNIGAAVAPALTTAANSIKNIVTTSIDWIRENQQVIATIAMVASGMTIAGASILVLGKIISGVGAVLGGLYATLMWAAGGVQLLVGAFGMLASPIGIAAAAIAALSAGFIYLFRNTAFVQSVGSAIYSYLQNIWNGFQVIFGELSAAWNGIVAAVSAGDLSAAMSIIVATVKLEWARLSAWFTGMWTSLQNEWTTLTAGFQILFVQAVAGIKTAWASAVGYMAKLWEQWKASTFTEGFADLIAPIFAAIQGVDVKDVRDQLHKDFARQRNELPQQQAQIDADTNARKTQIEKDRQDSESEIAARAQKTTSDRNNAIQDAQNDLDAAKKAQKAAIDAAHESKRQEEEKRASGKYTPPGQPESIDIGAMKAAKDSITGTFSGRALSGMGGGIQERIAKATEAAAKKLEQLYRVDTDMLREQKRMTLEASA